MCGLKVGGDVDKAVRSDICRLPGVVVAILFGVDGPAMWVKTRYRTTECTVLCGIVVLCFSWQRECFCVESTNIVQHSLASLIVDPSEPHSRFEDNYMRLVWFNFVVVIEGQVHVHFSTPPRI